VAQPVALPIGERQPQASPARVPDGVAEVGVVARFDESGPGLALARRVELRTELDDRRVRLGRTVGDRHRQRPTLGPDEAFHARDLERLRGTGCERAVDGDSAAFAILNPGPGRDPAVAIGDPRSLLLDLD